MRGQGRVASGNGGSPARKQRAIESGFWVWRIIEARARSAYWRAVAEGSGHLGTRLRTIFLARRSRLRILTSTFAAVALTISSVLMVAAVFGACDLTMSEKDFFRESMSMRGWDEGVCVVMTIVMSFVLSLRAVLMALVSSLSVY